MQIDAAAKYDRIEGQLSWEKQADDTFNGFVDFATIFDRSVNWNTVYAWTTVNSPDGQEAQLRVGNGTQVNLWVERHL